jgi:hypothetical protein
MKFKEGQKVVAYHEEKLVICQVIEITNKSTKYKEYLRLGFYIDSIWHIIYRPPYAVRKLTLLEKIFGVKNKGGE